MKKEQLTRQQLIEEIIWCLGLAQKVIQKSAEYAQSAGISEANLEDINLSITNYVNTLKSSTESPNND